MSRFRLWSGYRCKRAGRDFKRKTSFLLAPEWEQWTIAGYFFAVSHQVPRVPTLGRRCIGVPLFNGRIPVRLTPSAGTGTKGGHDVSLMTAQAAAEFPWGEQAHHVRSGGARRSRSMLSDRPSRAIRANRLGGVQAVLPVHADKSAIDCSGSCCSSNCIDS